MNIATSNVKGQIVIPKIIREALDIRPRTNFNVIVSGGGIQLHPIRTVVTLAEKNKAFLKLLEMTQGSWGPMTKKEKLMEKKRRALELARTRRLKKGLW